MHLRLARTHHLSHQPRASQDDDDEWWLQHPYNHRHQRDASEDAADGAEDGRRLRRRVDAEPSSSLAPSGGSVRLAYATTSALHTAPGALSVHLTSAPVAAPPTTSSPPAPPPPTGVNASADSQRAVERDSVR
jgi:hypothetical protein